MRRLKRDVLVDWGWVRWVHWVHTAAAGADIAAVACFASSFARTARFPSTAKSCLLQEAKRKTVIPAIPAIPATTLVTDPPSVQIP